MRRKTIGQSADNDLVLSQPSIELQHATVELADDGSIYVSSTGPQASIWLVRGTHRQRAQRVCLCLDDRLFLGQEEIPIARLTALFEATAGARLRHRKAAPGKPSTVQAPAARTKRNTSPRRNPVTGAIEN